ncbi:helix-turn-helix domain-containing protein [Nocardioides iriomotensis]|uniref:Helix-turn-helix domain-containing protein n=1 Tax=Nocardioides iriomotensis TaxID=715784 RepID=A0A4Q5J4Q9_9ACTN|nr:helix-turn-helix domain-containing protein [Nocardioides iriomotensis]RYU12688.1 helix-turn-helix domain-containing protein [Nocardioides iriomotensis]
MTDHDRLRELLDAVLDEDNRTLTDMAGDAYSSPFHFSRLLSRRAGEPPVAMRRRVMLERAAWQLREGSSVTDAAFAAGYDSVEGFGRAFTRAFGHAPSESPASGVSHWLPAPNGIHFHPPMSLWVDSQESRGGTGAEVTALMVQHDLDDVRDLLEAAKGLDDEAWRAVRVEGSSALAWDGPDECLAQVFSHLVRTKEIWLASVEGRTFPVFDVATDDVATLTALHRELAPRWLAMVRDIDRRGAWGDRLVDALCEPPESFVLGSVLAHVLTFSAHRRQLARHMLRQAGAAAPDPDPINWLRAQHRQEPGPA